MPCPACKEASAVKAVKNPKDFEGYATGPLPFSVMRCQSCRSMFLDPQPTLAQTSSFYAPDYMSKADKGGLFRSMLATWDQRSAKSFADRFGRESVILDYGCGDGSFIRSLREAGCKFVFGYDPMRTSEGIFSSIDQIREAGIRFDVIRMNDCIEHLVDVDATMSELRSLLSDKGAVYGVTPNSAHPSASLFGKFWGLLHFPYHTVIFSPRGLESGATRWGFSSVKTSGTLVPSGWAFTFEHAIKHWTRSKTRGHLPAYPFLLMASAPFVLADRLLPGKTTEFAFELRR